MTLFLCRSSSRYHLSLSGLRWWQAETPTARSLQHLSVLRYLMFPLTHFTSKIEKLPNCWLPFCGLILAQPPLFLNTQFLQMCYLLHRFLLQATHGRKGCSRRSSDSRFHRGAPGSGCIWSRPVPHLGTGRVLRRLLGLVRPWPRNTHCCWSRQRIKPCSVMCYRCSPKLPVSPSARHVAGF